jgi:hypothetical protein
MSKLSKDKFGVVWNLSIEEICPICGQPDSCGDCSHNQLSTVEVKALGGMAE